MDFHTASRRLTRERSDRKNRPKTAKGRRRKYLETPVGQCAAKPSFKLLVEFLDGKLEIKPTRPKPWLAALIKECGITNERLALMMVAPLLDGISRGWKGHDSESATMLLVKQMGEHLRDHIAFERLRKSKDKDDRAAVRNARKKPRDMWVRLRRKSDWDNEQCVRAGFWMMMQCVMVLNCFTIKRGIPQIRLDCGIEADALCEELMWRDQAHAPHDKPLPPWTGWLAEYDDRLRVKFVRDWRPETKAAINAAFEIPKPDNDGMQRPCKIDEHARGVSALRRVAFTIDPVMRDLVERFAVKIMFPGDPAADSASEAKKREAARRLISADISQAKGMADRPFYLDHNCDKRGRVYGVSHLNYGREDHVRSLFRFANGKRLSSDKVDVLADKDRWAKGEEWWKRPVVSSALHWLEIHIANCEGSTDKKPIKERLGWVEGNRGDIKKIARDPFRTFELWRKADKPFAYVAACRELSAAMEDPENFVTHLPIGFDGSNNGLQHLSMLCRDENAGKLVNLLPSEEDRMHDVYGDVAKMVKTWVGADDDKWSDFWRDEFKSFNDREIRSLLKQPVLSFAYNVTEKGMTRQISKTYVELLRKKERDYPIVPKGSYKYLANKTRVAAKQLLPKPAEVMRYISDLSEHHAKQNLSLEWTSPTGFPVGNRYHEPNKKIVGLSWGAQKVEYTVAEGCLPIVRQEKAIRSAAPNFVHSMDAAHLVRVVNAAAEGIDVVTVHDSFACLAPQAERFNKIIRTQLSMLYARQDHLRSLRDRNGIDADAFQPREYGQLDPIAAQDARYCWA